MTQYWKKNSSKLIQINNCKKKYSNKELKGEILKTWNKENLLKQESERKNYLIKITYDKCIYKQPTFKDDEHDSIEKNQIK